MNGKTRSNTRAGFHLAACLLLTLSSMSFAQDDGRYPTPEQAPAFREPAFITKLPDRAYPGAEYNVRPAVTGGTWPYRFSLAAAPEGMAIDPRKGTITWQAPSEEGLVAQVTVALTDQAGRKAEYAYAVTVNKAGFVFVGPDGDDANPGTFEKPWKTVMRAAQPVADPANTTLYLRDGTYAVETPAQEGKKDANMLRILRSSPRRWVAWPGEKPAIDLGWSEAQWKAALETERAKRDGQDKVKASTQSYGHRIFIDRQIDDLLFDGLEVKNAAYYMFVMHNGNCSRLTWRRCHLHHLYGDYAENPSFIFGFAPDRKYERPAPGESFPFGKRPRAKPYRHLVVQECVISDRPYDSPRGWHGGGLVWYVTQGCLVEDCRFERIERGKAILDKDNGWDNTYRNNIILGDLMIAAQGCNDGIDIHHNWIDGDVNLGQQPGWIRNTWLHHNAIRGRVRLLGGGTQGPLEAIDDPEREFTDEKSQALIRDYPHDRRLLFVWANAIDVPVTIDDHGRRNILDRMPRGTPFPLKRRFVWWDGNLVDEAAVLALNWRGKSMPWSEFAKACGFDVNGAVGRVAFDAEGRLPADSPWRTRFGRDAIEPRLGQTVHAETGAILDAMETLDR